RLPRTDGRRATWGPLTTEGNTTPWSMGTNAREAHAAYHRYYEHLAQLEFRILELQPLGVLADPEHRWGLAPFLYTQDVYEAIVQRGLEMAAPGHDDGRE